MKLRLNYNENESNIPLILNGESTFVVEPLENEHFSCLHMKIQILTVAYFGYQTYTSTTFPHLYSNRQTIQFTDVYLIVSGTYQFIRPTGKC